MARAFRENAKLPMIEKNKLPKKQWRKAVERKPGTANKKQKLKKNGKKS